MGCSSTANVSRAVKSWSELCLGQEPVQLLSPGVVDTVCFSRLSTADEKHFQSLCRQQPIAGPRCLGLRKVSTLHQPLLHCTVRTVAVGRNGMAPFHLSAGLQEISNSVFAHRFGVTTATGRASRFLSVVAEPLVHFGARSRQVQRRRVAVYPPISKISETGKENWIPSLCDVDLDYF